MTNPVHPGTFDYWITDTIPFEIIPGRNSNTGNFEASWITDRLPMDAYAAVTEQYYIDSVNGNDANSGKHPTEAWENLTMAYTVTLNPGDRIRLARGSDWTFTGISTGGFIISASGTAEKPIYIEPYGSGADPIIRNTQTWSRCIELRGNYIYVYGLFLTDAHEAGFFLTGENNYIADCEITEVGQGLLFHGGSNNEVFNCYVHDLNMVVNTPGWVHPDDDYGAVGATLQFGSSNNLISYCTFEDCLAPSEDYGVDGGVFELFGGNTDNNIFHHNYGTRCDGVYEISGTCTDNLFYYNVFHDNNVLGGIQMTSGTITNVQFYNNTIVDENPTEQLILFWNGAPGPNTMYFRNNIFWSDDLPITNSDGFTHTHNVYYRDDAGALGLAVGPTEFNADPVFVNRAGDDFRIGPASPAVDTGTDLGLPLDFDDNTVPQGPAPDIGAYELIYAQQVCTIVSVSVVTVVGIGA